ncbi:MAG: hypothetical protein ACJAYN_002774 [Bermanella sp.]|jgi:hypothetical protein
MALPSIESSKIRGLCNTLKKGSFRDLGLHNTYKTNRSKRCLLCDLLKL